MEKKKLLLIAVSVGVVLLIIIGIPLLIIAPRQNTVSPAEASVSGGVDQDRFMAFDPYQSSVPPPVLPPAETPNNMNSAPPVESVYSPPPAAAAPAVTTITVPLPQTVAVPDVPVARTQKPAAARPAPKPAAAKPAPAPAVKPAAQPSVKPTAVPAVKAVPAKAVIDTGTAKAAANNNYWIQTGAFSTNVRAEGMKDSLATKGITSIIDNRDIDGKTWYRVRVGPYLSENEANYWLALVKSMDGFKESQIRQSVR